MKIGIHQCTKCKEKKPISEFPKTTRGRGYQGTCKKCKADWMRLDRIKDPDKYRSIDYKNRYGITLEEYNELCEKQGNVCAICGEREIRKKGFLHIDHDHDSGAVRGLLCVNCNLGIGNLQHSIANLEKAITYLKGSDVI